MMVIVKVRLGVQEATIQKQAWEIRSKKSYAAAILSEAKQSADGVLADAKKVFCSVLSSQLTNFFHHRKLQWRTRLWLCRTPTPEC